MKRKITKYEQFLCLQMFETLYLTETTGAEIVIQRVPGGYIWREWSKEQGQVNGFNSVFVEWDHFFLNTMIEDNIIQYLAYDMGGKGLSVIKVHKSYSILTKRNIYETAGIRIDSFDREKVTDLFDLVATFDNGKLIFNGELE